jgi:hypothetical protein
MNYIRIKKLVVTFKNPNEKQIEKILEKDYFAYESFERSYESWCVYIDIHHKDSALKTYLLDKTYEGKEVEEMYHIIQYILL